MSALGDTGGVITVRQHLIDRMIRWSFARSFSQPLRFLLATGIIVGIAAIRAAFVTDLVPWILFVPAIACTALVAGERAGLYACGLAAVLAGISIAPPGAPSLLTPAQWAASLLFVAVTVGIVWLVEALRRTIHEMAELNARLAEREAFLTDVLAASTDCIKVLELDGTLSFMSEGGMKVMEISDFNAVKGCPWPDFWQDAGNLEARRALDEARAGRSTHFNGAASTYQGTPKWWSVSVSPIFRDGRVSRILSVSRDMSSLKQAEDELRLLNGELGHRLKNILTLVQSIAVQTFRQTHDVQEATQSFGARMAALGKATDALTASSWQSAHLRDVVAAGLASVATVDERIEISGPTVELNPQATLALNLALHELATNAIKHGALSNADGRIVLDWAVRVVPGTGEERLQLTWTESGGPVVVVPSRRGFGSRMIERSLTSYFRGEAALSFEPGGVVFRLDAPLGEIGSTAAGD